MARNIAPDAQEAIATARFIRMSPSKVRRVVDLIRGRHVEDARRVLRFTERGAAHEVAKVLDSAIANAENNRGLPADELLVARAWVDEGPTLKRFRPRAMGRATRVRKRTCHISVVVGRDEELLRSLLETPAVAKPTGKPAVKAPDEESEEKTTSKKTAAKKTTSKGTGQKKSAAKKKSATETAAKKPAAEAGAPSESPAQAEEQTPETDEEAN